MCRRVPLVGLPRSVRATWNMQALAVPAQTLEAQDKQDLRAQTPEPVAEEGEVLFQTLHFQGMAEVEEVAVVAAVVEATAAVVFRAPQILLLLTP